MSSPDHVNIAAYALGRLESDERARFEEHLATCEACRDEVVGLSATAEALGRAAPPIELPPALQARTFMAIERAAVESAPTRSPRTWFRWPRVLAVAAAAAAVAGGVFVGTRLGDDGLPEPELQAVLTAPTGEPARATARVTKTGIGRVIEFRTDDLMILPKGDYYELWFVGPGDTLRQPNRISAGTFHPDDQGRSQVTFAAAVDPKKYPVLSVTAEPGDGNPRRTGPEVLRSQRDT
jgi:anti-sigma-K factor RskA